MTVRRYDGTTVGGYEGIINRRTAAPPHRRTAAPSHRRTFNKYSYL